MVLVESGCILSAVAKMHSLLSFTLKVLRLTLCASTALSAETKTTTMNRRDLKVQQMEFRVMIKPKRTMATFILDALM